MPNSCKSYGDSSELSRLLIATLQAEIDGQTRVHFFLGPPLSCLWLGTQEKHKMKNKEKRPKRFADKPVQSFSSSFLLATITTHLILRICVCLHFASF